MGLGIRQRRNTFGRNDVSEGELVDEPGGLAARE